jgi:copper chaperone
MSQNWEISMTESLILTVEGMKCGGCEANITNKLNSLAGVESVTASRITKEVKIDYDSGVTDQNAIAKAISEAGYNVVD